MQDIFDDKEIITSNSNIPLPMDINFTPQNATTVNTNINSIYPEEGEKKPFELGIQKEPYHATFTETAKTQFGRMSSIANVIQAFDRMEQDNNPFQDQVNPGWKPTDDLTAFEGVQSKYTPYILAATSPKEQRRRYNYVLDQQQKEELVKNGSTLGWLTGGFLGISPIGSPETLIPIAGQVKYARYAPTIINSALRAAPGMLASSAIHNAATESNDVAGNLENYVVNTFADTVFGSLFMGGITGVSRLIDSGAIWEARKALLPYYHGIDFKVKVNPEGEFKGFEAHDTSGTLSAAEVSFAQDYADSTFAKSGIFKIPYLGEGTLKVFGAFSPLVRMSNSRFESVRAFVDRVADHSFITEGIEKGKAAPQKFENLWNQLQGSNRSLAAQVNGLHVARNGFDISNRAVNSIKSMAGKVTKAGYTSREEFGKEIRNVLINETSSPHAAVNEAAALIRKHIDDSYAAFRKVYGLSEKWMSPKTAKAYMMRIYNTPYMIGKENEWHQVITGWLKQADEEINSYMQPIHDMRARIMQEDTSHQEFIRRPNITNEQVKKSSNNLEGMRRQLNAMEEKVQNEIRENEDLRIHVEDVNALSANEAKELKQILKPLNDKTKQLEEQQSIVSTLKNQRSKKSSSAKKGKTVETAKKHAETADILEKQIAQEESKLNELKRFHSEEEDRLQQMAHNGEIDSHFFTKEKDSFIYNFKNPNERLKFRDVYKSDDERFRVSKGYYDTILNQTPEQAIDSIMNKMSGSKENPLKERTLLVPDNVIAPFLSNDIVPNVVSYRNFLGRKTFIKHVFNDVTIHGNLDELVTGLVKEHEGLKQQLNKSLSDIAEERKAKNITEGKTIELDKRQKNVEDEIIKLQKKFDIAKEQMSFTYDKMMGKNLGSAKANRNSRMIMAYTAAIRLGFVPFTMISDLSANILQHGLWPFIRDGLVPSIESLGGLLKTQDSEALRKAAPHVNLGLQDVLMGYADKNYGSLGTPYVNLGNRFSNGLENVAHLSSNLTGTTYFENGLQHISAAIMQSKIIASMYEFKAGMLSDKDLKGLLKYGLDPKEWADKFITAFEKEGGGKTKLGGYQSRFWEWSDLEASNKISDTVFRGVKDTVLSRGMLDAPFFMDNPIGAILMGFKGWTFASLNRYVIPSMQTPDAQKLMGIAFMLGAGALVSPMRRIASGKNPYPDNVTQEQILWAAFQDSGYFSFFGDMIADMNLFTGGVLNKNFLGNLTNDRYRDRTLAGLLGPAAGVVQDLYSVAGMAASGEANQNDINKMIRLIPFTQVTELRGLSNKFVEGIGQQFDLPKTRGEASRRSVNQ